MIPLQTMGNNNLYRLLLIKPENLPAALGRFSFKNLTIVLFSLFLNQVRLSVLKWNEFFRFGV